jgi:hypothetical protein
MNLRDDIPIPRETRPQAPGASLVVRFCPAAARRMPTLQSPLALHGGPRTTSHKSRFTASSSPVHPCELKTMQLAENKGRAYAQPGTLTIPQGSSSPVSGVRWTPPESRPRTRAPPPRRRSRGISPLQAYNVLTGDPSARRQYTKRSRKAGRREPSLPHSQPVRAWASANRAEGKKARCEERGSDERDFG